MGFIFFSFSWVRHKTLKNWVQTDPTGTEKKTSLNQTDYTRKTNKQPNKNGINCKPWQSHFHHRLVGKLFHGIHPRCRHTYCKLRFIHCRCCTSLKADWWLVRISVERFAAYSSVTSGLIPVKPTWPLNGKLTLICTLNSIGRISVIALGNMMPWSGAVLQFSPATLTLTHNPHPLLLFFFLLDKLGLN